MENCEGTFIGRSDSGHGCNRTSGFAEILWGRVWTARCLYNLRYPYFWWAWEMGDSYCICCRWKTCKRWSNFELVPPLFPIQINYLHKSYKIYVLKAFHTVTQLIWMTKITMYPLAILYQLFPLWRLFGTIGKHFGICLWAVYLWVEQLWKDHKPKRTPRFSLLVRWWYANCSNLQLL